MCKICNIHKGKFDTEAQYLAVKRKLNILTSMGLLEIISQNKVSPFYSCEYQCKQCKKIWVLQIPDQAFRGGWDAKC